MKDLTNSDILRCF